MIEEIPEASQGAGIRVALRLNLPLYTHMAAGAPTDLAWSALRRSDGQWTIEARNGGGGWVRVDARAAEAATGVRFGDGFVFGTVLPGASRRWTIGATPTIADRHRFQRLGAANDGTSLAHQRAR
jgi:P pilus assembly chaperone PapD